MTRAIDGNDGIETDIIKARQRMTSEESEMQQFDNRPDAERWCGKYRGAAIARELHLRTTLRKDIEQSRHMPQNPPPNPWDREGIDQTGRLRTRTDSGGTEEPQPSIVAHLLSREEPQMRPSERGGWRTDGVRRPETCAVNQPLRGSGHLCARVEAGTHAEQVGHLETYTCIHPQDPRIIPNDHDELPEDWKRFPEDLDAIIVYGEQHNDSKKRLREMGHPDTSDARQLQQQHI